MDCPAAFDQGESHQRGSDQEDAFSGGMWQDMKEKWKDSPSQEQQASNVMYVRRKRSTRQGPNGPRSPNKVQKFQKVTIKAGRVGELDR